MAGRKVHVYIDETGDRGSNKSSSPIFGMAAVLVDESGVPNLRSAVDRLREDFRVPAGQVMSWKDHVKTHDRRRWAADVLGGVEGIKVCYVYAVKSELRAGSYRDDPQRFYNYVAYMTYKATLWAARDWVGADSLVWTRFGHVRHHDHRTTEAYIRGEAAKDPRVPFGMEQGLCWVSADRYAESQAADLYGGSSRRQCGPTGSSSTSNRRTCCESGGSFGTVSRARSPWGSCPCLTTHCSRVNLGFPASTVNAEGLLRSLQGPIH